MLYYLAVSTLNPARCLANIFFAFLCHLSLLPEVYEIETENSEPWGGFGSQQQHLFELGDSHDNGSGIIDDLIQKLSMFFSTEELMMKDEEEAHSEEITAAENDRQ